MSDRDTRREMADTIASALESRADIITTRSAGLTGDEFCLHVGLARGFKQAAEMAAKLGREDL